MAPGRTRDELSIAEERDVQSIFFCPPDGQNDGRRRETCLDGKFIKETEDRRGRTVKTAEKGY